MRSHRACAGLPRRRCARTWRIVLVMLRTPLLPVFLPPRIRLTSGLADNRVESTSHRTYESNRILSVHGFSTCAPPCPLCRSPSDHPLSYRFLATFRAAISAARSASQRISANVFRIVLRSSRRTSTRETTPLPLSQGRVHVGDQRVPAADCGSGSTRRTRSSLRGAQPTPASTPARSSNSSLMRPTGKQVWADNDYRSAETEVEPSMCSAIRKTR
jgi:hypothetical protein